MPGHTWSGGSVTGIDEEKLLPPNYRALNTGLDLLTTYAAVFCLFSRSVPPRYGVFCTELLRFFFIVVLEDE